MNSPRLFASVIGLGALASALLVVAPRVTHATSPTTAPTVAVRYGDLDLNSHNGVKQLYRRIQIAAIEVCRSTEPFGSLLSSEAHQACLHNAIVGAVRSVNSPLLSQYYGEHDPRTAREGWLVNAAQR
jgi:UrcA family protein